MIRRIVAQAAFGLKYPGLIRISRFVNRSQWFSYEELKRRQEQDLKRLITFAYERVPYYRKSFQSRGLRPEDINTIHDLEKLPILNKKIIRENWDDFLPRGGRPIRYVNRSTSGSTGTPFRYRWSRLDVEYSLALIFRSRGIGGYRPGDRIATLSTQLQPVKSGQWRIMVQSIVNQKRYSWFNMDRERILKNFEKLNRFSPEFIISSPLVFSTFAKFIDDNKLQMKFRPKAVFSNGEKLLENQRAEIEKVMGTRVFDIYGLDDGGVTAAECEQHNGWHIDMERGILEVVDAIGAQVSNVQGRIVATGLKNYAMPFIRYETGDLGVVTGRRCPCGRQMPLLEDILGRIEGYLNTPSGVRIHGTILGSILGHVDGVHQFQIVQYRPEEVTIRVIPTKQQRIEDFDFRELKATVAQIDKDLVLKFELISEGKLEYTSAGKYKFVINRTTVGD